MVGFKVDMHPAPGFAALCRGDLRRKGAQCRPLSASHRACTYPSAQLNRSTILSR